MVCKRTCLFQPKFLLGRGNSLRSQWWQKRYQVGSNHKQLRRPRSICQQGNSRRKICRHNCICQQGKQNTLWLLLQLQNTQPSKGSNMNHHRNSSIQPGMPCNQQHHHSSNGQFRTRCMRMIPPQLRRCLAYTPGMVPIRCQLSQQGSLRNEYP